MRRFRLLSPGLVITAFLLTLVLPSTLAQAQGRGGQLQGLDGGTLTEAQLQQKDTILVFWASWSPRGRDIVARVNPIYAAWNGKATVVTVNFQEDDATIRKFLSGKNLKAPVFVDNGSFSRTPSASISDYPDGRVPDELCPVSPSILHRREGRSSTTEPAQTSL